MIDDTRSGDSASQDAFEGLHGVEQPHDPTRWKAAVQLLRVLNPELHNRLLEMIEAAAARARKDDLVRLFQ